MPTRGQGAASPSFLRTRPAPRAGQPQTRQQQLREGVPARQPGEQG